MSTPQKSLQRTISSLKLPAQATILGNARASHAFLLTMAYSRLFPGRSLMIDHSFGDAYYCHDYDYQEISDDDCFKLHKMIETDLDSPVPIELTTMYKKDVITDLRERGYFEKIAIVNSWPSGLVPVIRHGKDYDIRVEDMSVDKEFVKECAFEIMAYDKGILLRFPLLDRPDRVMPFVDHPRFFKQLQEYTEWNKLMDVLFISELNHRIYSGQGLDIVHVAEGLQLKNLVKIADDICSHFPQKKIICIAGPSSSGKTTFARKLAVQLKCNGYDTIHVTLDDYYRNREDIVPEPDGTLNFEKITALDLDILCQHLTEYVTGQKVQPRKFSFKEGRGQILTDPKHARQLGNREFVIVEGIHGLNPIFGEKIGRDKISTIYVSALTQMNIDRHHRIPSSDLRLIRRIVRDFQFRGYSALDTMSRWSQVRKAEHEFIFPFQHTADYIYNSALVYELCVLSMYAKPLLVELQNEKALTDTLMPEVERLLTMVNFFYPLSDKVVPSNSLLREFIGGSDFDVHS